nr:ATP-binding cassette domain-containing protein [Bifidobacterium jacchi]
MGDITPIEASSDTTRGAHSGRDADQGSQIPAILTRHLTKRYGKARGIDDVNLTVRQGEIFGFIGPNGAGKSTTIRTLLGLIRKTGGEASILGLDCERDRTRILGRLSAQRGVLLRWHARPRPAQVRGQLLQRGLLGAHP